MTEIYRAEDLSRDSFDNPASREYRSHNRNQPFWTPLDLAMGVIICVMIWGPLAAGAFSSN